MDAERYVMIVDNLPYGSEVIALDSKIHRYPSVKKEKQVLFEKVKTPNAALHETTRKKGGISKDLVILQLSVKRMKYSKNQIKSWIFWNSLFRNNK